MQRFVSSLILFALLVLGSACNKVDEALDVVGEPNRKTIDVSRLGANAFVNDGRFGSINAQFRELRDRLGIRHVRVLFAWTDGVQPTPSSSLNFSFYDDILDGLPSDMDALIILTDLPSWMTNPANWVGGNPRRTFVDKWVKPAAERYSRYARVTGFQIWNEPNDTANPDNNTLDVTTSPENYVELLSRAENVIRNAGRKLVVSAATTAINQNYPESLNYNRGMRDAGALEVLDIWGMHYYGKQFENVKRDGGVADFFGGITKPVWVTESGAQGVNSQLAYGEQVWPFLRDEIPQIERIYQYQFTEATPSDVSYGMRTLDGDFPVSDLYIHLNERNS